MSSKSDFFFAHIKQIYPTFPKPSGLETEIWEEILEPYDEEFILKGIKSYRKSVDTPYAPSPAKFCEYLYQPAKKDEREAELPMCPASYLMQEDQKAGRCVHFFPTYEKAVQYILNQKTKELLTPDEYKQTTYGERYRFAVDNGLFADFDTILDLVYNKKI